MLRIEEKQHEKKSFKHVSLLGFEYSAYPLGLNNNIMGLGNMSRTLTVSAMEINYYSYKIVFYLERM